MSKTMENQFAILVVLNASAAGVRQLVEWLQPVLTPILTLGQIAIAAATVVWIWQRVKGQRLDNRIKQKELDKNDGK